MTHSMLDQALARFPVNYLEARENFRTVLELLDAAVAIEPFIPSPAHLGIGTIRHDKGNWEMECPITHACRVLTGEEFPLARYDKAARALGIPEAMIYPIINGADGSGWMKPLLLAIYTGPEVIDL